MLGMVFQRDLHNPVGIPPVFLTEEQFLLAQFKHPPILFVSSKQGKYSGPGRSHISHCFLECQIPSHSSGTICCPLNIKLQCSHRLLQLRRIYFLGCLRNLCLGRPVNILGRFFLSRVCSPCLGSAPAPWMCCSLRLEVPPGFGISFQQFLASARAGDSHPRKCSQIPLFHPG